ncbi:hypothetical protein MPER_04388 [Moniliophthora perniciosa FA553]|nr:hypothetical protein MPER_04388 [Moniliophthora perniciosa FA553]
MASAMRANGLVVGDRVAAIITNSFTAVTIALATASIGGVFSSTATDMGTQGILDRYRQIQPKLVFAETEVLYAGKTIDLMPKVTEVIKDLSAKGLSRAILLPSTLTGQEGPTSGLKNAVTLHEFMSTGTGEDLVFEQLPFNQPLFILYSFGTSGPPKCIVHSAGGVSLMANRGEGHKTSRLGKDQNNGPKTLLSKFYYWDNGKITINPRPWGPRFLELKNSKLGW